MLFADIGNKLSCRLIQLIFVWHFGERICDLMIRASGLECQPCQPGGPGQVTSHLLFTVDALPPAHLTLSGSQQMVSASRGTAVCPLVSEAPEGAGRHFGMSPKGTADDPGVLRRVWLSVSTRRGSCRWAPFSGRGTGSGKRFRKSRCGCDGQPGHQH